VRRNRRMTLLSGLAGVAAAAVTVGCATRAGAGVSIGGSGWEALPLSEAPPGERRRRLRRAGPATRSGLPAEAGGAAIAGVSITGPPSEGVF
jgi:hypothetical protein